LIDHSASFLVNGFINFVIPLAIYLISQRRPVKPLSVQEVTTADSEDEELTETYVALPRWRFLHHTATALGFIVVTCILSVLAIVLYIIQAIKTGGDM
jgi:hypothetical protein